MDFRRALSLRVGQRLGLAALLFLFPVAYLTWLLTVEQNVAIQFANKEIDGTHYLRGLLAVEATADIADLDGTGLPVGLLGALHQQEAAREARLDVAGAWAVMQVVVMTRVVGHANLNLIAARRRLPPEVLQPVFDQSVADGWLSHEGTFFSTTPAGDREAQALSAAWSRWLNDQLEQDQGHPTTADLRAAADAIAKRLLVEDLASDRPALLAK